MMMNKLPYKNFRILGNNELKDLENKLRNNDHINVNGKVSYFLEVDLEYPEHLHKSHEQWPLAPEKYEVTYNDLTFFQDKTKLQ